MKKTLFLMTGMALAAIACTKQKVEPNTIKPDFVVITSERGEQQIQEFLQVYDAWLEDPSTTLNDMTKEDAVWLMEASINYKNAFQLSYWENRVTVDSSFSLSEPSGNEAYFTGQSILEAFEELDNAVTEQKNELGHNMVLVVDVALSDENATQIVTHSSTATSVPVQNVSSSIGIGPDDYWKPAMLLGKCGPYQGQYSGIMDAAERVEQIVNHNWWFGYYLAIYTPQNVLYFTDNNTVGSSPGDLWTGAAGSMGSCLNPTDMQTVFNEDETWTFNQVPTGYQLIFVNYEGWMGFNSDAFHYATIRYGIPHIL